MKPLHKTAELLYRGVNRLRRRLYRSRGLGPFNPMKGKRLHRPVISIGNIAAGGTGKTPAVIAVARHLTAHGLRVAVLTRGYGRKDSAFAGPVLTLDAEKYGDEPVLIKKSVNVDVLVGSNRHKNAIDYPCDVFILDDGFQHLQIERDLDLVIDAPAAFYREGPSALRDADIVIPRRLRTIVPPELVGQRVFAFAGLADNRQFFETLRAAGLELAGTRSFGDHHRYTPEEIALLVRDAAGLPLVTTGKDAVKLPQVSVIAIDAEFEIDQEVLNTILQVARGEDFAGEDDPEEEALGRGLPASRKRKKKSAFQERFEYLLYRAAARTVASMSEESIARWGTRLGTLTQKILRKRDRQAMRNLGLVYPDRDPRALRELLAECWRHFGREALLSIQSRNWSMAQVAERCPLVGIELVDESIARGKGTVILSAHWGGWEIAGLAVMTHVQNLLTVARPLDNELLERELQELRARTGAEIVDRRKAARPLMRALAENGTVVLLPDQSVLPREGVLVPFLGPPAWTTTAPAKLALRAGSTIVFTFCIADGLRHRLEFVEPIRVDLLTEEERDPVELTRRINDVLSRRIHSRPEHWLWMHDRWKGTGERGVQHGV